MAKSWDQMSKEERKATGKTKKEYNQSTGQSKKPEQPKKEETKTFSAKSTENSASQRHREAMAKAQSYKDEKTAGYKKIEEYQKSGGSRSGTDYQNFLNQNNIKDSGYSKYQQQQQKQKYDAGKQAKKDEAAAYQQYTQDKAAARKASDTSAVRKVDQSQYYQHMKETTGSYGDYDAAKSGAIDRLVGTGQKFSNLDVQREMGSKSTHNQEGLYKQFGGFENYKDNFSVGSGNFRGDDSLGTMKEADDKQRQYFQSKTDFYNSDDFNQKYGQYDFAQKDKQRSQEQANKFNQSFDKRQERMAGTAVGKSLGFS